MVKNVKSGRHLGSATLVIEADPKSPASEAYRTLRTNIRFAGLDQPCRTVAVTSAVAGEGKTTSAANFAVAAAQGGSSVCLVDSDLRRPSLHRVFDLPNTGGLTQALMEGVPFSQLAQATRLPNLVVLTSGSLPPNPGEMVGSRRMREALDTATETFDLVICDTPPIISVSDAVTLAAQCDGVILVVRVATVPHEVLQRACAQIDAVKGRILGVVLNCVNLKRDGYYSDYYRYYQSYYGDNGKKR